MARPKVYDDDLRSRLVASAADRIAEGGVDSLSLRALSGSAGTSTNAIYTLFGSKEGLVAAVVTEAVDGFTGAQEVVARSDDPIADLSALGHAYRTWVLAHPALYAVLMGGRVPVDGMRGTGWTQDRTAAPLLAGVRRALSEGALVADDPEQVAITLWAGVHGMVTLETILWGDLPPREREQRFSEHLYSLACRWLPQESRAQSRPVGGSG